MRLTWRRQILRPRYRFATSQGGIDERETLVVQLEHAGEMGLGEAVPSALYGQSIAATEAVFADADAWLGEDPFAREAIIGRLIARHDGQRAALAAVDSALHDWIGRRLGLPVWRWLGLPAPRVRTTFTIGVAEPDLVRVKVDEALRNGYDALKVKVGTPRDDETLTIVRERFNGPLLLDANQAWSAEEAPDHIRALGHFRPALIEQPLRREDWAQMAALRQLQVAPIFADESCERPADVVRLRGIVDGVNIKLTKCGGIREALRMITLARAFDTGVMLGCFVSSSLAIAPALSVASLADFVDLDGHLLLAHDPYQGIARRGSELSLSDRPGLGIVPRGSVANG